MLLDDSLHHPQANGAAVVLAYFILRVVGMGYVGYMICVQLYNDETPFREDPGIYLAGVVVGTFFVRSFLLFARICWLAVGHCAHRLRHVLALPTLHSEFDVDLTADGMGGWCICSQQITQHPSSQ
jgi:hypothetical protein